MTGIEKRFTPRHGRPLQKLKLSRFCTHTVSFLGLQRAEFGHRHRFAVRFVVENAKDTKKKKYKLLKKLSAFVPL